MDATLVSFIAGALSAVAVVISLVAVAQTRRYQNRADLRVVWDQIGLAGGIREQEVVEGLSQDGSLPYMKVSVFNFGEAAARKLDLSCSTAEVAYAQETDDGAKPYAERAELLPGPEPWEVEVPLFPTTFSFDHPGMVRRFALERPTVTVRWRREYSRRVRKTVVKLSGDWLANYGQWRENEKASGGM
jgi:hypothetical protein